LPGGLGLPQEEQTVASASPQSPQNFCPVGFSAPQLEQAGICQQPIRRGSKGQGELSLLI
jgi:hypothetical protein